MELSDFGRDILRVLSEASRPLSFEDITAILREKKNDSIVVGQVRSCLEQALSEHVEQVSSGKWKVASSHEASFGSTEQSASAAGVSEAATRETSGNGMDEARIGGLVLKVLTEANSPLAVEQIVKRIQTKVNPAAGARPLKTRVTRELQSNLSSCVEQDADSQWSISTESDVEIGFDSDRKGKDALDSANANPLLSRLSKTHDDTYRGPEDLDESKFLSVLYSIDPSIQGHVAAEIQQSGNPIQSALRQSNPELAEEHAERVEAGGPGAKPEKAIDLIRETAGEIEGPVTNVFGTGEDSEGEQAENQKADRTGGDSSTETLSFLQKDTLGVLDEESGGLSLDEVAEVLSVLTLRGWEATQKGVERCLKSTLSRFVQKAEDGYYLEEERDREQPTSKQGGSSSRQGSDGSRNHPVDQATRASVSGRRYSYEFEKEVLETSYLFVSRIRGGTVEVKLNSTHPGFEKVQYMVDGNIEAEHEASVEQYRELFHFLIAAWTKVEGDHTDQRSEVAEEIRNDWGRALHSLLR